MKTNCSYCGAELNRPPYRIKKLKNSYCNPKHQMANEYEKGIRDKFKITKKANETLRKRTLKRFNEGKVNIIIGKRGYRLIYLPKKGWYKEHQFLWEKYHHKKLPKGYHIHHINGDKLDNRIENLELISAIEHGKKHYKKRKLDKYGRFKSEKELP